MAGDGNPVQSLLTAAQIVAMLNALSSVALTTPVSVPLGSAAAPSISFTGDATTGFYSAGAGKVDVSISGTKVAEWTSAGLSTSQQITSTVSIGTAPFVVASTTAVANLNASLLLGGTWAAPGAIGSGTPASGAFTTLSATGAATVDIGSGSRPAGAVANPLSSSVLSLFATDGLAPRLWGEGYGNAGIFVSGRAVGGTRASPAAVGSGQALLAFTGTGYDGVSWTLGTKAQLAAFAGSLWSATSTETYWEFKTTPSGSTSPAIAMQVRGSGNLLVGLTSDGGQRLQVTAASQIAVKIAAAANNLAMDVSCPNTTGQSFGWRMFAGTNSSDYALRIRDAADTKDHLLVAGDSAITMSGNVTVGAGATADPFSRGYTRALGVNNGSGSSALTVNAATGNSAFLEMGVNGTRSFSLNVSSTAVDINTVGSNALTLSTANVTRVQITAGGNVMVGVGTDRGVALQVEHLTTLSAGVGDDFSSSIMLAPSYTAAFTVARACYVYCRQPLTAGGAAVTDACVFMFDANAGTHKAVDTGTTKTTPGTVNAWVKVSVNGTVHYLPAYTSKTT